MANKFLWYVIILLGAFPFIIAIFNGVNAATLGYTSDFDFSLCINGILSYSITI